MSYLGWLGVLGLFGLSVGAPTFLPFLLFFLFFSYGGMKPDELFWQNVSRASMRAFWSVFTMDAAVLVIMLIRGLTADKEYAWIRLNMEENSVVMGAFTYNQYAIVFFTFIGSILLMILVFTISMMRFKKKEKKMLDREEVEMEG